MYPYIFVFDYKIPSYLLCALIGIVVSFSLALVRAGSSKFNTPKKDVLYTLYSILAGALFGAKLFQIIGQIFKNGNNSDFWTLENLKDLLQGVGVFYGGLIGGFLFAAIYIRVSKLDFYEISNIITPSIPLFHAFGRIGCFFAGCCYGAAGTSLLCIDGKHQVQLYEAGYNLLVIIPLIFLSEKIFKGNLLLRYMVLYSAGRFFLEFLRGDNNGKVFIFSVSQWISVIILLTAISLTLLKKQKTQKNKERYFNEKEKS